MMSNSKIMIVLLIAASAACGPSVRNLTYPPSFKYVPESKLKSTMWQLAGHVSDLETTIQADEKSPEKKKEASLYHLTEIERLMGTLGSTPGNHPVLGQHVPQLLDSVRRAKAGLLVNPPSFFAATQVSGACNYCHSKQ